MALAAQPDLTALSRDLNSGYMYFRREFREQMGAIEGMAGVLAVRSHIGRDVASVVAALEDFIAAGSKPLFLGFGSVSVTGRNRVPCPPTRISACTINPARRRRGRGRRCRRSGDRERPGQHPCRSRYFR